MQCYIWNVVISTYYKLVQQEVNFKNTSGILSETIKKTFETTLGLFNNTAKE